MYAERGNGKAVTISRYCRRIDFQACSAGGVPCCSATEVKANCAFAFELVVEQFISQRLYSRPRV